MLNSEVLYGAAAHIDVFGLMKHGLHGDSNNPETSPACALGAITVAAGVAGHPLASAIAEVYRPAAALRNYLDGPSIPDWNNADERTAEEVSGALRAVALIEAAKENPDAAKESAAVQVPAEVVA